MSARSKARRRAVEVLYEIDVRGVPAAMAMESLNSRTQHAANEYTVEIVDGVTEHVDRINEVLATYAEGWTLDRMPAVDRAILRVGTWELLYSQTPESVAIAEAVLCANELSTDESGRYINGLLARIRSIKGRLVPEAPEPGE